MGLYRMPLLGRILRNEAFRTLQRPVAEAGVLSFGTVAQAKMCAASFPLTRGMCLVGCFSSPISAKLNSLVCM